LRHSTPRVALQKPVHVGVRFGKVTSGVSPRWARLIKPALSFETAGTTHLGTYRSPIDKAE